MKPKMLLPSPGRLNRNGYRAMYAAIRTHRALFSHIPQDTVQKTLAEYVLIAERLARGNKGLLPRASWLAANGYRALLGRMHKQRESFLHIPRDIGGGHHASYYIPLAESLASANGGQLPSTQRLIKSGHSALYQAVKREPKLFNHIPKERLTNPIETHVQIAKRLAAKNGGVLPNGNWLRLHGYDALRVTMQVHPIAFKGIRQRHRQRVVVL